MTEQVHIEGLDAFQDHDLTAEDDTPPDAILCDFRVVSEYMPGLSEKEGKRVYKNFIHFHMLKELGRYENSWRLKDQVEYQEDTKKWKITKLAPKSESWIKKFPREWNAFYNGVNSVSEGTPIEFLFPNDPSRADMYKRTYVGTIERLAALTETDCQLGGMGWLDDKKKAMAYVLKLQSGASDIKNNAQFAKLESENKYLKGQIDELTGQVRQLLQIQLDEANKKIEVPNKKKPGKKPAKKEEISEEIQGL